VLANFQHHPNISVPDGQPNKQGRDVDGSSKAALNPGPFIGENYEWHKKM
jgi:hypothetical protein